jgi:hypothetical protein
MSDGETPPIVVERLDNGKIKVCFGAQCVEVACAEEQAAGEVPVRIPEAPIKVPVERPGLMVKLPNDIKGLAEIDWKKTEDAGVLAHPASDVSVWLVNPDDG